MSDAISRSSLPNRIRAERLAHGLSQEQLALRAGLSRTEVSAIENGRVTPSVAAGLALARALDSSVERLFGTVAEAPFHWGESIPAEPCRVWLSRDAVGAMTAHRVERTHLGTQAHDALWDGAALQASGGIAPERTLILAGCDPAVGILAGPLAERGIRLIPLIRSSRQALAALSAGCAHVAGFHLGGVMPEGERSNLAIAGETLGAGYRLTRMTRWEEGLALAQGVKARTTAEAVRRPLRWVGREAGSGAQLCLERLFAEHGVERRAPRNTATDHYGVAQSVAMGWADVGVCTRLAAEQTGLNFLLARRADYDFCWPLTMDDDPRIQALAEVIRSRSVREMIASLPGYETCHMGDTVALGAA